MSHLKLFEEYEEMHVSEYCLFGCLQHHWIDKKWLYNYVVCFNRHSIEQPISDLQISLIKSGYFQWTLTDLKVTFESV